MVMVMALRMATLIVKKMAIAMEVVMSPLISAWIYCL